MRSLGGHDDAMIVVCSSTDGGSVGVLAIVTDDDIAIQGVRRSAWAPWVVRAQLQFVGPPFLVRAQFMAEEAGEGKVGCAPIELDRASTRVEG